MADRDPEGHARRLEDAPAAPGHVPRLLVRVDLRLRLDAEPRAVRTDDVRDDLASCVAGPLGTDNRNDTRLAGRGGHLVERRLQLGRRLTSATSPCPRCPGSPVSGRQTIRASRRPASSTAATAAGTAWSSVTVSGVEATAIRTVDMPAEPTYRLARCDHRRPGDRVAARRRSRDPLAGAARPARRAARGLEGRTATRRRGGLGPGDARPPRAGQPWPKGRWTDFTWALLLLVACGLPDDDAGAAESVDQALGRFMPDGEDVDGAFLLKRVDLCHLGFWTGLGAYFRP